MKAGERPGAVIQSYGFSRTAIYKWLKAEAKGGAGLRSDAPPGRTWAPRGQTPVLPTGGQRQAINAISAVTPRGDFRWRTFSGRLNASRFREFLGAFMHRRRNPVFLSNRTSAPSRITRARAVVFSPPTVAYMMDWVVSTRL